MLAADRVGREEIRCIPCKDPEERNRNVEIGSTVLHISQVALHRLLGTYSDSEFLKLHSSALQCTVRLNGFPGDVAKAG